MKCSAEFVIAYNNMFKFLNDHFDGTTVETFWEHLSDLLCQRMVHLAKTKGIPGLVEYWAETLEAEGARCKIIFNTNGQRSMLTIQMFECPSIKKLKEHDIEPCSQYCGHCQIMYQRALEKVGLHFECSPLMDGRCHITVFEKGYTHAK
jgi:hypothetical protein